MVVQADQRLFSRGGDSKQMTLLCTNGGACPLIVHYIDPNIC